MFRLRNPRVLLALMQTLLTCQVYLYFVSVFVELFRPPKFKLVVHVDTITFKRTKLPCAFFFFFQFRPAGFINTLTGCWILHPLGGSKQNL